MNCCLSLFNRIVPLLAPVKVNQSEVTRVPNTADGNCQTLCILDDKRLQKGGVIKRSAHRYTSAEVRDMKREPFLLFLSHVSGYY